MLMCPNMSDVSGCSSKYANTEGQTCLFSLLADLALEWQQTDKITLSLHLLVEFALTVTKSELVVSWKP